MSVLCPVCKTNETTKHPTYGVIPCDPCNDRRRAEFNTPNVQVELTADSIKQERLTYGKSIVQPYRSGQLSKEYLDIYGTKNIKPTKQEIKNAKPVWKDIYSPNMDLSKTK